MTDSDKAYLTASDKLEKAARIWMEKQTNQYPDAERLFKEAVEIRDKFFL